MKRAIFGIALVALCSCGSPPKVHEFQNNATVRGDFDKVWSSVVSYFANQNIPIDALEKESGIITAKIVRFEELWMDCGKASFLTSHQNHRGSFNVFVREVSEGEFMVQVTADFACDVYYEGRLQSTQECYSTGDFEEDLLAWVRTNLQ